MTLSFWIFCPVLIVFAVWNSGYRQGTTGRSIGRSATKTKLVKIETGEPIGFGPALLRLIFVAAIPSIVVLIGFLLGIPGGIVVIVGLLVVSLNYAWSLWDPKRQTVADKIVKAVVVRIDDATT